MSTKTILGTTIVFFVFLSAYLFYVNHQLKQTNLENVEVISEKEAIQAQLESEYETALAQIESLRGENEEMNAVIANQKEELKAQKGKISKLIWTKGELEKAKSELATLQGLADQYVAQLTALQNQNAALASENDMLTIDLAEVTADLASEKITTAELTETRAILTSVKEDLTKENKELSKKVELGSAIKINWMDLDRGTIKSDGTWKNHKLFGSSDALRLCFRTETNVVTPAGNETFYVQIVGPTGETISTQESNDGEIIEKTTGETVRYTTTGTLVYNKEDTKVCMEMVTSVKREKGDYTVSIFNKDYRVGRGSFHF